MAASPFGLGVPSRGAGPRRELTKELDAYLLSSGPRPPLSCVELRYGAYARPTTGGQTKGSPLHRPENMVMRTVRPWVSAVLLVAGTARGQQQAAPSQPQNPLDAIPEKMPFDVAYGAPIPLARAEAVIAAARAEATRRGWKMNIAVVDSGANLVAFLRMDDAQLASIAISEHKARVAVMFRRETKTYESAVQGGNVYALTLDGMIASRGGLPLVEGGKIVGGIGCSGGTGSQDEVVAKAGAAVGTPGPR